MRVKEQCRRLFGGGRVVPVATFDSGTESACGADDLFPAHPQNRFDELGRPRFTVELEHGSYGVDLDAEDHEGVFV